MGVIGEQAGRGEWEPLGGHIGNGSVAFPAGWGCLAQWGLHCCRWGLHGCACPALRRWETLFVCVHLFLFASECGWGRCVCGERSRALLPKHPSCHGAWYTKPTAFIFKLGLKKKKVDLMSCRMSLFVNPLPDAPVTSCYVML